jgi:hypothetical protein
VLTKIDVEISCLTLKANLELKKGRLLGQLNKQ